MSASLLSKQGGRRYSPFASTPAVVASLPSGGTAQAIASPTLRRRYGVPAAVLSGAGATWLPSVGTPQAAVIVHTLLLDDLADLLSTGGMTTPTYKGHLPALASDTALCLYETGGMSSIQTMSSGPGSASTIERPRVQIVARDRDPSVAMALALSAYDVVDGLRERPINGTRYLWAQAVQPPFYLETDGNARTIIAFNVDVLKVLSTSTST